MCRTPTSLAAVVVVGRKPGESDSLLAAESADLRQTHQDRDRGRQPDAVDAVDQLEPLGEVTMLADRGDQALSSAFSRLSRRAISSFQSFWMRASRQVSIRFLRQRDILADLIDHRQMLGKRLQPGSGAAWIFLHRRGAGCDQSGIDLVVLGPLQVEFGIGPHLRRLEHHHHEPLAPQLDDDRLLIAAARLDPDALDPVPPQPRQQNLVTLRPCSRPATARGCRRSPRPASVCRYRSRHRSWYAWSSSSIPPL